MSVNQNTQELQVKLLYNLISASAENPGKLIPKYDSSDHPIFEVLDRGVALSKSLEKLASIPGIGSIAQKLLSIRERKRSEAIQNAEEALEVTDVEA